MSKETLLLWGREFDLPIQMERYSDESILPSQTNAVNRLINASRSELNAAKKAVKEYVLKKNPNVFSGNDSIDNIFRYVIPKSIFVPHDEKHSIAAIFCNYKFDPEHGLAIVFNDGKFKTVGPQDIVL